MSVKLEIVNPLTFVEWDKLVLANNNYSFFHSSGWAKVLSTSYGYKPLYFSLIDRGKLRAVIPIMEVNSFLTGNRGVSLPFSDYCEPLNDETIDFRDVIHHIIDYGKKRKWKFIELRGGDQFLQEEPIFSEYYGHTLTLKRSEEEIFSSFRNSNKRNIKKAAKAGVAVKISNSLESTKAFYQLNCRTRKKHGLPPQPYYFFKRIYDHIISKNSGCLTLATYEGETIAGAVYFHFGSKVLYKYGASDEKYQNMRANNLVMWEAIKWYSRNGYERFCFGRTETSNQGLRQFKDGWGTNEYVINYYRYNIKKSAFINAEPAVSGRHNKIFNKMPMPILKTIGSILYKHVG